MDRVLVVVGYTDMKYWCRPLFPKIFEDLTYVNKEVVFVTDEVWPGLSELPSGEMIAAAIRDYGIKYARKNNFDWLFTLDVDTIPDPQILETLLSANAPLISGVHVARGDSTNVIGHYYKSFESLERTPLHLLAGSGPIEVDGASGGMCLIHKSIFEKVDYSGYTGPETIPGRFTADDEYFQIKVRRELKIRPKIHCGVGGWHLDKNGFGYRWYGNVKPFQISKGVITFQGKRYEQK